PLVDAGLSARKGVWAKETRPTPLRLGECVQRRNVPFRRRTDDVLLRPLHALFPPGGNERVLRHLGAIRGGDEPATSVTFDRVSPAPVGDVELRRAVSLVLLPDDGTKLRLAELLAKVAKRGAGLADGLELSVVADKHKLRARLLALADKPLHGAGTDRP